MFVQSLKFLRENVLGNILLNFFNQILIMGVIVAQRYLYNIILSNFIIFSIAETGN